MDPQTNLYLSYYTNQSGGALPAFTGARRGQYGAGLGDIFRGIFRTLFPIAAHGANAFLNETLRAKESGNGSWSEAAKSAISPTAHSILTSTLNTIRNGAQQSGGGRTRRRRRRARIGGSSAPGSGQAAIRHKRRGYKRRHGGSKGHKRRHQKKIKFLNF